MSAGNAAAAIGLANTNKIPPIGVYVQTSTPPPGPGASGPYIGVNGSTFYSYNALGSDPTQVGGFLVPSNAGAAAGKDAQWVTTGGSPMTVAADGLCAVSAGGVVTALATTGTFKCYIAPGTVIPAGSYLWVFVV